MSAVIITYLDCADCSEMSSEVVSNKPEIRLARENAKIEGWHYVWSTALSRMVDVCSECWREMYSDPQFQLKE